MDTEKTIALLIQQRDKLAADYHNMQVDASIALQKVRELEEKLSEAESRAEAADTRKCSVCGNPCVCPAIEGDAAPIS